MSTNKSGFLSNFTVKALSYSSICLALAAALHMVKLFHMPQGGSVTLFSMFFVTFIGFLFGPVIGILGGLTFGLLQMIIDPYFVHPVQILLDYILAFSFLGFSGFFSNKKYGLYIGFTVACVLRYISHVISGYVFFASFAQEKNMPVMLYTVTYNLYILVEMALTLILLAIPSLRNAITIIKSRVQNYSRLN